MTSERVGVGVLVGLGLLVFAGGFTHAIRWANYQIRNDRRVRRGSSR